MELLQLLATQRVRIDDDTYLILRDIAQAAVIHVRRRNADSFIALEESVDRFEAYEPKKITRKPRRRNPA